MKKSFLSFLSAAIVSAAAHAQPYGLTFNKTNGAVYRPGLVFTNPAVIGTLTVNGVPVSTNGGGGSVSTNGFIALTDATNVAAALINAATNNNFAPASVTNANLGSAAYYPSNVFLNGTGGTNLYVNPTNAYYPSTVNYWSTPTPQIGNQMWGAMRNPAICVYVAPYQRNGVPSGQAFDNESNVVAYCNFMVTNNYVAAIKAAGVELLFVFDIGWDGRRNFNPAYIATNAMGTLYWDSNNFPDGMPWLVNKLSTNGIGTILGIYGTAAYNPLSPTVSGMACAWTGATPQTYTNGIGGQFVFTNGNYHACEIMLPETIESDVQELRFWGLRGFIINDLSPDNGNYLAQLHRDQLVAKACSQFSVMPGWNQSAGVTYFNQNLSTLGWGGTNGFIPTNWWTWANNRQVAVTSQFFTNSFAYFPYSTKGADFRCFGDETRQFKSGINYENWSAPLSVDTFVTNYLKDFSSLEPVWKGGRPLGQLSTAPNNMPFALICSHMIMTDPSSDHISGLNNNFAALTNAALLAIMTDPLQEQPQLPQQTFGTQAEAMRRKLLNGSTLLYMQYNGSTNTYHTNINFAQIGLSSNTVYKVSVAASYGEYGTWPQVVTNYFVPTFNQFGSATWLIEQVSPNPVSVSTVTLSQAFGGFRQFSGSYPASSYQYLYPDGGYDTAFYYYAQKPIGPGTYTNFFINQIYPTFTGTNYWVILTNALTGGTPVEAMRVAIVNAGGPPAAGSNTTSSFYTPVPIFCTIGTSNSTGSAISGPFCGWSLQKY